MEAAGRRWAAASGFAFAVLFIASLVLLGDLLGSVGDPDDQFVAHFASEGNRARDAVGAYLLVGAGLAFLVFAAHLRSLGRPNQQPNVQPAIALGAALAFAAALIGAAAALGAVPTSMWFADLYDEEAHEFGPDALRLATQLGFMLLVFGMLAAALAIASTSLSARKSGLLPGWLVWLGLVLGVVLLFAFFIVPGFALPLWVLAISIVLLLRSQRIDA